MAWTPFESTLAIVVCPVCMSCSNTSMNPFTSPGTRFVAKLPKTTKRPSPEIAGNHEMLLPCTPEESTLAQTVVSGDPSYAGPLAGVPLGLPVLHVFESDVKDQVPADVYEAQVALMEMSLDRDAILKGLKEARGS